MIDPMSYSEQYHSPIYTGEPPSKDKTLDEWLEECPDKLQFFRRFIDCREDIKRTLECEEEEFTEDDLEYMLEMWMRSGFVENAEDILYMWGEYQNGDL